MAPDRVRPAPVVQAQLESTFGHRELHPGQASAITAALAAEDVLVVMPTGAGKSLCYQLPAVCGDGLTVVVPPLIALMRDQTDALRARNVPAAALHSLQPPGEGAAVLQALAQGRLRLLYLSPERLGSPALRSVLAGLGLTRVVVDEAHCVVRWGHDFRPEYLNLPRALASLGDPPLMALTATATRDEQRAILEALGRPGARRVVTGFDRPELYFAVQPCRTRFAKAEALLDILRRIPGPALVYAGTRAETEAIAKGLSQRRGIMAAAYHSGLAAAVRHDAQTSFLAGRLRVVVATSAFGMGIDKPDVRAVVHWTLPLDLTAYYQAAGRAGRDGQPALSALLYSAEDHRLCEWKLATAAPTVEQLATFYVSLVPNQSRQGGATAPHLASATGLPKPVIGTALAILSHAGIVRRAGSSPAGWSIVRPPQPGELALLASAASARRIIRRRALAEIVAYALGDRCRRAVLLEHFGQVAPPVDPGCCDRCHAQDARQGTTLRGVSVRAVTPQAVAGRASASAGRGSSAVAPRGSDSGIAPLGTASGLLPLGTTAGALPLDNPTSGVDLGTRALAAIAARNGRLTVGGLARVLARPEGAAEAATAPLVADARAAVDRLVAAGLVVVHHGHGRARLALSRRGWERHSRRDRTAEAPAAYFAARAPALVGAAKPIAPTLLRRP